MVIENLCPVCGYEMEAPPQHYRTCPSCGTEFGVHDVNSSILELRRAWIMNGLRWWSPVDPQPDGWNAIAQLARVQFPSTALVYFDSHSLVDPIGKPSGTAGTVSGKSSTPQSATQEEFVLTA